MAHMNLLMCTINCYWLPIIHQMLYSPEEAGKGMKEKKVLVTRLCLTLWDPTVYSPWGSSVHGILQARMLEAYWITIIFSRSFWPRDRIWVSCIACAFFTSWTTRETQEYRVGSLSLLQGIFPAQELTQGLLYCRQILYQLSQQGRLDKGIDIINKLEVPGSLKRSCTYCIPGTGTKSGDNNN